MQNDPGCYGISRKQVPPRSELYLTGGAGAGSTNTAIAYFPTVAKNTAAQDLIITNTAALGTIITVATAGVYTVSLMGCNGGAEVVLLICLNGTFTTSTIAHTDPSVIAAGECSINGFSGSCSATLELKPGDTIKCTWSSGGSLGGLNSNGRFRITKIG